MDTVDVTVALVVKGRAELYQGAPWYVTAVMTSRDRVLVADAGSAIAGGSGVA